MINDFAAYICTLYTQYSQDGLTPLHVVSDLRIAKFLMLNGAKVNMPVSYTHLTLPTIYSV